MAHKYDLTHTLAPFLDRHMTLPLLEFLSTKKLYDHSDLQKAKYDVVSGTNMLELVMELHKDVFKKDPPQAMQNNVDTILQQLAALEKQCEDILRILKDTELTKNLRENNLFNMEYLVEKHNVKEDAPLSLFKFAKLKFDCGHYNDSMDMLYFYRLLAKNEEQRFLASWGQLASSILNATWQAAMDDLDSIKEQIDQRFIVDPLEQLQQRTWLVHWGLFVFFCSLAEMKDAPAPDPQHSMSLFTDFVLKDEKLLNAVQLNCPHILRYLSAAVVVDHRRKNFLNDYVYVLKQERHSYSDPVTSFLLTLCVDFDLEGAHKLLEECETVFQNDYFLQHVLKAFMEQARILLFDTVCRTHKYVNISLLARYIGCDDDDEKTEMRIVQLIRELHVDAKIDSDNNQLVLQSRGGQQHIYQQVIDKTKQLVYRTNQLSGTVEKKFAALALEPDDYED